MAKRLHARALKLKAAPGNWCKEAGLCQMQSSSTKYKTWRYLAVNTPAVHCLYPDAYYLALISCLSSSIFKLQSQFYSVSVIGEGLKHSRQCGSTVTTCFIVQHYGPGSYKMNLISSQSVIKHGNSISFASSIQHLYGRLRQQYEWSNKVWDLFCLQFKMKRDKDVTPLIIMCQEALDWARVGYSSDSRFLVSPNQGTF